MTKTDSVRESRHGQDTLSERLAARAHETVDSFAEHADRRERELREAVSRTADQARQLRERARTTAEESAQRVASYLESHPIACVGIACIGIAFAAGVLLSAARRS